MSIAMSDMNRGSVKNFSLSVSIVFHIIVFSLLLFVKFSADYPPDKYVELSFGNTGMPGSSGAMGNQLDNIAQVAKIKEEDQTKDKSEEVKNGSSSIYNLNRRRCYENC